MLLRNDFVKLQLSIQCVIQCVSLLPDAANNHYIALILVWYSGAFAVRLNNSLWYNLHI